MGERGITLGRTSHRGVAPPTAPRPAMFATGIIGGIACCAPACRAGAALAGNAVAAPGLTEGAIPVHPDGTDRAPIKAARPIPAVTGGPLPRPDNPAELNRPVPELRPPRRADPNALAVLPTALAAVLAALVPPIVNNRVSMLIGIIAILAGMVSMLSDDSDDIPCVDDDEDDPDASPCSAWGVAAISCGPADISVSACVAAEVPAPWATAATWLANPAGSVVGGGAVNGASFAAAADAPA